MSTRYAFVTLLTSDLYLPGALAIAGALKDVHQTQSSDQQVKYDTVCMVTPETLDVTTIRLLRKAFDVVIGVEVIVQPDVESLALLGRPDLDTVLTKLHVFRLTQYTKAIFLDADVLPIRPLSHLFGLDHEFSAVPDVGWPDIFNSGVMVLSPGEDKFKELQQLLKTKGSWDGADQGILNEWRGNNWNRLSFTYNTTPTAAYTYAPAYERFGSQISAVHFIGSHKPWHSIPYRAPGSSVVQPTNMDVDSASTETLYTQQPAYDYGSLVDRWYNVYDRHYRSQSAVLDSDLELRRYTSAWNEQNPTKSDTGVVTGGALGLEELRRLALEGMGSLGMVSAHQAHGEGEYQSMPLEGRFDLMRPRTRAERKQEQPTEEASHSEPADIPAETSMSEPSTPVGQIVSLPSGTPVRWMTLPTPGADELPPAPHARLMSLPPTPLHYAPAPYQPSPATREIGAQTGSHKPKRRSPGGAPSSPPFLAWNAAVEPPPKSAPPPSAFPIDTYFPNVWDRTRARPAKPQATPHALFDPLPAPEIPEMLLRQGHYRNVTGEVAGSPTPDRTKVKRVFPWEERPRHAPGRMFPEEEPPLPAAIFVRSPPAIFATPEKKATLQSPMPSPLVGFPPSFQSHHPWGGAPVPYSHANKFTRPAPSPSPLAPAFETPRKLLERSDTNSQDGDVEDEIDSEEEASVEPRSRSSSVGTTKRGVEHRSVGVQTDARELRDEGVQVTAWVAEKRTRPKATSASLRRHWPPSTGIGVVPPMMATDISTGVEAQAGRSSSVSKADDAAPTSIANGGNLPVSDSPPSSPPTDVSVRTTSTTPKLRRVSTTSPPSVSSRKSPGDACAASPVSSVGPLSPADGKQVIQARRGSRVWDPARGVELFKRGSEEVLARFLKMGSWEERT
ncbi:glycosyltransferase family 8 protein [Paxillus rubicundulus Ve08.2h10]|uniref:glycogenin glucosyltransferase n=1 Tax=Paxillus rubicundulus Ve08.2h10 TaxID=930991 RepID=A0A0D0E899_9AGAM|nr:glycosyltransferase family 8 protein [Paxillus rubicundulus Ve08.2h10]